MTITREDRAFADGLAGALRDRLAERGGTVADLARAAGLAERDVDKWLNAKRDVPVAALGYMSAALGVAPSDLVADAESRRARTLEAGGAA